MSLKPILLVSALAVAAVSQADVLYSFESLTAPTGTSTTMTFSADSGTGQGMVSHASASAFSTPVGNGSSKALSSNTWASGDYYQFTGSTLGIAKVGFSFDQAGSGTGPANFNVAYSLTGAAGSWTTLAGSDYTLSSLSFSSTAVNPLLTHSFDLSSISSLSNQASVYFRIVDTSTTSIGGGTVASGGTDRVDNVMIGPVQAVPEPSAFAALGLGAVALLRRKRGA